MKMLNGENEYGIVVPYIFVTNGGGKTEAERCVQLSKQMEIEVSPGQFICGHTPMREMASKFKTVLVVGGEGEKCREVAEGSLKSRSRRSSSSPILAIGRLISRSSWIC